ncbi:hypothetical protein CMQ_6327 [Grosmannia clavigera kw1407]|uniref:Flavoprotein domain-containing protein n=1 Tax=Grosmannia clavigera (strain kw1407 / UAMH 11150) TaxID=655863 RepID=F0XMJ6_GROCL|nr:uncharacterized protein CMQ_6327 [Grosmannia clavigera kw1407]EFX01385.1 hypothetical protein CMQ_6327 [Grosmannia clavigera kw1407]
MDISSDEPPPPFVRFLPKTSSTTSFYEMPHSPRLKLLVAANGPKEVAYAQAIAVRLSKEPKISIRVIVDDLTHRLAQEFPTHENRSLRRHDRGSGCVIGNSSSSSLSAGDVARDIECARKQAFDLVAWADLLVLAPIDADHMAKMMAGVTDTLLLELLRSWDASKRILLVPGMSTHMWENPVTKRQISKLHRKWHWVRVLPPILWHYYQLPSTPPPGRSSSNMGMTSAANSGNSSMSSSMVGLDNVAAAAAAASAAAAAFAGGQHQPQQRKRVVEWHGFADLIGIIKNQADLLSLGHDVDVAAGLLSGHGSLLLAGGNGSGSGSSSPLHRPGGNSSDRDNVGDGGADARPQRPRQVRRLPPEVWTMILEYADDWELAQALNVFTHLPMPTWHGWRTQPRDTTDAQQVFMHELEWTLLTADTDRICAKLAQAPAATVADLSALAIRLIFKFSLTNVLAHIEAHCPLVFRSFDGKTVPTKASAYFGRTDILDWWARSPSFLEKQYDAEALDGASKNGYVHVLEWWRRSGLPLKYTEAAMEQASARGHVQVLEWWRQASLVGGAAAQPIIARPGRSLICAAQYGRVNVLRWWEEQGREDEDEGGGGPPRINPGHQDAVCKVASRWGQVAVLELWRELRGDGKLVFGPLILVEPTMYSHIGVLDWWRAYAHGELPGMGGRRAKQVEYRIMDIEEALEDALGDQTTVRRWWAANGLNLGLGTSEWMKAQYL